MYNDAKPGVPYSSQRLDNLKTLKLLQSLENPPLVHRINESKPDQILNYLRKCSKGKSQPVSFTVRKGKIGYVTLRVAETYLNFSEKIGKRFCR